jgi:hypothetical protein
MKSFIIALHLDFVGFGIHSDQHMGKPDNDARRTDGRLSITPSTCAAYWRFKQFFMSGVSTIRLAGIAGRSLQATRGVPGALLTPLDFRRAAGSSAGQLDLIAAPTLKRPASSRLG